MKHPQVSFSQSIVSIFCIVRMRSCFYGKGLLQRFIPFVTRMVKSRMDRETDLRDNTMANET